MDKIIVFYNELDFNNSTRKATLEAINKKYNILNIIRYLSINKIFYKKDNSSFIKIKNYYKILSDNMINNYKLFYSIQILLNNILFNNIKQKYKYILLTRSQEYYLLEIFNKKKIIFLISDPYHLMGQNKKSVNYIVKRADIIITTSKELKNTYLKKYFNHDKDNVYYWPNTVNIDEWNIEKLKYQKKQNKNIILGFAGNFMELTDLYLLDLITDRYQEYEFQLAGKLTCDIVSYKNKFDSIIKKENVVYLGWIPYKEIPKIVMTWDVCLMLDDKSELSSYHHHNKLYQYLALGKPVVINKNHSDYDYLKNVIYLSGNYNEYLLNINKAIKENDDDKVKKRIKKAKDNCSEQRADEFMQIINNIQ